MIIRNKESHAIHIVAEGTRYPAQYFEEVTEEQLKAEKEANNSPKEASKSALKPAPTKKTITKASPKKKSPTKAKKSK